MPTFNYKESDGTDVGDKGFVTKDYVMTWYPELVPSLIAPELLVWGRNDLGQLGDNSTTNRTTSPVRTLAPGINWRTSSAGEGHTIAIKIDGGLWATGNNAVGQLGDNSTTTRSSPVNPSGGGSWLSVSCGQDFTAAIKTDGSLWCWGNNGSGRLGDGSTTNRSSPVSVAGGTNQWDRNQWKQVSAGANHAMAVKTDGTLWGWGLNSNGQLGTNNTTAYSSPVTPSGGGTNWKQVSCGANFSAGVKTDGTLWVWGLNTSGQLGTANTTNTSSPWTTSGGGTNWNSVSLGYEHVAAIKTDGTLWMWGLNTNGRLGDGSTTTRSSPVTTAGGATTWKFVSCGAAHTIAIKTDGSLWTWGENTYGQLNDGTTTQKSSPGTTLPTNSNNWKSVGAGYYHSTGTTEAEGW
jgi:alpha-tubulin suppressor-like RCC1 family protein